MLKVSVPYDIENKIKQISLKRKMTESSIVTNALKYYLPLIEEDLEAEFELSEFDKRSIGNEGLDLNVESNCGYTYEKQNSFHHRLRLRWLTFSFCDRSPITHHGSHITDRRS